jgi:hypothetical protein
MRLLFFVLLTATTFATLLVCAPLSPAWGFLGLFNKEKNQKAVDEFIPQLETH